MSNVRAGDFVQDLIIKQKQGMAAFPHYSPDDVGSGSRSICGTLGNNVLLPDQGVGQPNSRYVAMPLSLCLAPVASGWSVL